MKKENASARWFRRLKPIIIIILFFLLFSYALDVTNVNLREPLEPKRRENLARLLRELADPNFFEYENETRSTNISIRIPCPEEVMGSQVTIEGRQLLLSPNCASDTRDQLTMIGEGFERNVRGIIRWYPPGASPTRIVSEFRTDNEGSFESTFTMPDIRESDEPQRLEVGELLSRRIIGLSETSKQTSVRIIETIFMALIASTAGTILAVPISFLGARNIMSDVTAPLASIMAALIAFPLGGLLALTLGNYLADLSEFFTRFVIVGIVAFLLAGILALTVVRIFAPRPNDEQETSRGKLTSAFRIVLVIILSTLALGILSHLTLEFGDWSRNNLGIFSFIGKFIYVVSDFVRVILAMFFGLLGALVAASFASKYAQEAVFRLNEPPARILTAVITIAGVSILIFGLTYFLNWICVFGVCNLLPDSTPELLLTIGVPALIVGSLSGLLSLRNAPNRPYSIGTFIYATTRTILNGLRAIEPIILGFVFVIWVGIGPFAGVLALMLHSIADLGKLFSEQVENIDEGPLEAVTSTGADRIQAISYAVIPQIIPHYIAFIFYRWDINVRMSTIIGFVGGGGIGLILFRSTNLTQYRQASVMVIVIAIVVTAIDYASSRIRKQII